MSAYLDKSQGVTFVYSNIYQLYLKAKHAKLDGPFHVEREAKASPEAAKKAQVQEFKPRIIESVERPFTLPMGVKEAEAKALKTQLNSMDGIKKSLDGLKDAHAKLRFLLKELEEITKK